MDNPETLETWRRQDIGQKKKKDEPHEPDQITGDETR